ncbi:nuclear transport factor 2 family protein [Conexibacter sp. SYSU D00693]|uniref:nuclear transport factor 2 family protein n=1 Tax=Conexibacter sp. SYSU D00693 TaxID=2812560 RepID=UPI00196A83B8|nr:nuclear transport factor 2 family protein [Conexibacter sp. SYSU D00693]
MGAREVLDRFFRLAGAGDVEGLAGLFHEDAVLVRLDGAGEGRAAVRDHLAAWVAQAPRLVELGGAHEAQDTVVFHAQLELGGQEVRIHGTFVLRGERIWRWTTAPFPSASGQGRGGRTAVTVDLEPYAPWPLRPVPDVRSAGREVLGPVLLEVVATEGPVLADYAYRQVVRASGGKALTSIARAPLSGAAHRLRNAGAIEMVDDDGVEVLRPAGAAPVRLRELGPRALDEVPPSELAELVRRLHAAGATDLPRAALDAYGLVRMTGKAQELLARAVSVATAG